MKPAPMKQSRLKIIRICFGFMLFIMCMIIFLCIWGYNLTLRNAMKTTRNRADEISNSLNAATTKEQFDKINTRRDRYVPEYQQLQDLLRIVRVSSDVQYLYTAKMNRHGSYVYLVDGMEGSDEDFRYPGDRIEEEFWGYFDEAYLGKSVMSDKIISTEWGNLITCFYPVFDLENPSDVYGILGITFNMDGTVELLYDILYLGAGSLVFIIIVIIMFVVIFQKEKRNLVKMNQLEKETKDKDEILRFERLQYKDALIQNCYVAITLDITEGIIGTENIIKLSSKESSLPIRLPIKYDECIRFWKSRNNLVISDVTWMTCKDLLDAYSQGVTYIESSILDKADDLYYQVNVLLIKNEENGHIHASVIAYDITEGRKKEIESKKKLEEALEEAQKANLAKTDFLSRISHDIRTPMNAIIGMTELALINQNDKKKVVDYLGKIKLSGEHLLSLINEVLDLRKIESGTLTINNEKVNLSGMIEEIVQINKEQLDLHRHSLEVDMDNIHNPLVYSDKQHLEQILVNLISNSIKYTKDGGHIRIAVIQGKDMQNGYHVYEFCVEDDGIGMSKEYLEHIFEPFTREEDSRISKVVGTGLGMAIVKSIVDAMNGQIDIRSEINHGTKTTVSFAFEAVTEDQKAEDIQENEMNIQRTVGENHKSFSGKRVLVVDDQELNREIVKDYMDMLDVSVDEAENGRQALDMLLDSEENYYGCVFMDVQMPVMNGYEATKMIRQQSREDIRNIVVVAMTANAFNSDVNDAVSAGMNMHMSKPVDFKKIKDVLEQIL